MFVTTGNARSYAVPLCERVRHASERIKRCRWLRQLFLCADHETTAGEKPLRYARQKALLQCRREIREREVATKDKIKRSGGRLASHILANEDDAVAVLLPHAE